MPENPCGQVRALVERAVAAQQAINELGAGPPSPLAKFASLWLAVEREQRDAVVQLAITSDVDNQDRAWEPAEQALFRFVRAARTAGNWPTEAVLAENERISSLALEAHNKRVARPRSWIRKRG